MSGAQTPDITASRGPSRAWPPKCSACGVPGTDWSPYVWCAGVPARHQRTPVGAS